VENVRHDFYRPKGEAPDFPVLVSDGSVIPSRALSGVLQQLPSISLDTVYIRPDQLGAGKRWLHDNKSAIIGSMEEMDHDE
jgi:hypothetical protein